MPSRRATGLVSVSDVRSKSSRSSSRRVRACTEIGCRSSRPVAGCSTEIELECTTEHCDCRDQEQAGLNNDLARKEWCFGYHFPLIPTQRRRLFQMRP